MTFLNTLADYLNIHRCPWRSRWSHGEGTDIFKHIRRQPLYTSTSGLFISLLQGAKFKLWQTLDRHALKCFLWSKEDRVSLRWKTSKNKPDVPVCNRNTVNLQSAWLALDACSVRAYQRSWTVCSYSPTRSDVWCHQNTLRLNKRR